jgi:hypothetical protein
MCGRYVSPEQAAIERQWHIGRHNQPSLSEPFAARYNVAPQQGNSANYVPVVRQADDGELELVRLQWWLLPFWAKEPRIKYSTFNARVETVAKASSFREPLKRRRCIIPALGWYEWQELNDRAIEDFLRGVEPGYNASVAKLREDKIDKECIHAIAGFVGYVACCAPAAMRIHAGPLQSTLESEAAILDKQGLLPRAPPSLGSKTLTELLTDKEVGFTVDPKYPQALGINSISGRVSIYGNSKWEILLNGVPECPFFTSDFPLVIEATGHRTINWIVPLTPDLAIRIIPDIQLARTAPDLSFAKFTSNHRMLRRSEIVEINRLIVRCAEDLVFYRDNHDWIGDFIAKNRHYRVEAVTDRIPYGRGFMNISTQRIVLHNPPA